MDKEKKRLEFKIILDSLDVKYFETKSETITNLLYEFLDLNSYVLDKTKIQSIGFFSPLKREAYVKWTPAKCEQLFPADVNGKMCFAHVDPYAGIQAPFLKKWGEIKKPDLLLVPGLGFDFMGQRLGRGKGFYDKFLESYNGISMGVCLDEQLVKLIPTDVFDKRVNYILVPQGIWSPIENKFVLKGE